MPVVLDVEDRPLIRRRRSELHRDDPVHDGPTSVLLRRVRHGLARDPAADVDLGHVPEGVSVELVTRLDPVGREARQVGGGDDIGDDRNRWCGGRLLLSHVAAYRFQTEVSPNSGFAQL